MSTCTKSSFSLFSFSFAAGMSTDFLRLSHLPFSYLSSGYVYLSQSSLIRLTPLVCCVNWVSSVKRASADVILCNDQLVLTRASHVRIEPPHFMQKETKHYTRKSPSNGEPIMCTSESITMSSVVRLAFFALGVCFLSFVTPLTTTHLSLGKGLKVANYFFYPNWLHEWFMKPIQIYDLKYIALCVVCRYFHCEVFDLRKQTSKES